MDYQNRYQWVVMVILSAQDSNKHINELVGNFFSTGKGGKQIMAAIPKELWNETGWLSPSWEEKYAV